MRALRDGLARLLFGAALISAATIPVLIALSEYAVWRGTSDGEGWVPACSTDVPACDSLHALDIAVACALALVLIHIVGIVTSASGGHDD